MEIDFSRIEEELNRELIDLDKVITGFNDELLLIHNELDLDLDFIVEDDSRKKVSKERLSELKGYLIFLLSVEQEQDENYDEAMEYIIESLKFSKPYYSLMRKYNLHIMKNEFRDCIEVTDEIISRKDDYTQENIFFAINDKAMALFASDKDGHFRDASKLCKEALNLDPNNDGYVKTYFSYLRHMFADNTDYLVELGDELNV